MQVEATDLLLAQLKFLQERTIVAPIYPQHLTKDLSRKILAIESMLVRSFYARPWGPIPAEILLNVYLHKREETIVVELLALQQALGDLQNLTYHGAFVPDKSGKIHNNQIRLGIHPETEERVIVAIMLSKMVVARTLVNTLIRIPALGTSLFPRVKQVVMRRF